MSTKATTNMTTLLTNIKTVLLGFRSGTLSSVNTWQRGVIGTKAIFPAIAIVPTSEEFSYRRSNNRYKVTRNINVEVYARQINTEDAFDQVTTIVDALKNIFQDNHTFSDSVYQIKFRVQELGEPISFGNTIMQRGMITLSCLSDEGMPAVTQAASISSDVSPTTLVDGIKDTLINNKVNYSNLNKIQSFWDSVVKPIPNYPAIFVGIPSANRQQTRPGSDDLFTEIEVDVLTNLIARENSLDYNLSIVEDVKDVLQANYQFGGKIENSVITRIIHEIDETDLLYVSSVRLRCKGREYLELSG